MKLTLLYKANTPADREIDYLCRKLDEVKLPIEKIDADSLQGQAMTELYDAMDRPAVIATSSDGRLIQLWQGQLPTVSEIQGAASLS